MNLAKIDQILAGQPAFRDKQLKKDLYERLITDWNEATSLPEELRKKLAENCPLEIDAMTIKSKDGKTIKALVTLEDGLKIETVLMRYPHRNTVCVSTQVGCPVGCVFCATGKIGFKRNLIVDEIVEQVVFFGRYLKPFEEKVSRVVLMGMGEPFLNFENVISAIRTFNDQQGLAIGARKISVSTVGLPDKIRKFADLDLQTNLALSLHAPTDELRRRLIPSHTSLKEILAAVDEYLAKTKRKVMIEYVMITGVNDSHEQAIQLAKLLGKRMVMVNLIKYNLPLRQALPGFAGQAVIPFTSEVDRHFRPSLQNAIEEFKGILKEAGIETTQRYSFGADIMAACGQLAGVETY